MSEPAKTIGASRIAAIFGAHPFASAADVLLDLRYAKRGQPEASEAAAVGLEWENPLIDSECRAIGVDPKAVVRQVRREHPTLPLHATLDALTPEGKTIIEAKTSGIMSPTGPRDVWGPDGSDLIPEHYVFQVAAQLICTPSALEVRVPALLAGRGRQRFRIPLDARMAELIDRIKDFVRDWHTRHVVNGEPLPNEVPPAQLDTLAWVQRVPRRTVEVSDTLYVAYQGAKERLRAAVEQEKTMKAALLTMLGDAEAGTCEAGRLTYKTQSRRGFDVERLRQERPEVAAVYEKTSVFPVLRLYPSKENDDGRTDEPTGEA